MPRREKSQIERDYPTNQIIGIADKPKRKARDKKKHIPLRFKDCIVYNHHDQVWEECYTEKVKGKERASIRSAQGVPAILQVSEDIPETPLRQPVDYLGNLQGNIPDFPCYFPVNETEEDNFPFEEEDPFVLGLDEVETVVDFDFSTELEGVNSESTANQDNSTIQPEESILEEEDNLIPGSPTPCNIPPPNYPDPEPVYQNDPDDQDEPEDQDNISIQDEQEPGSPDQEFEVPEDASATLDYTPDEPEWIPDQDNQWNPQPVVPTWSEQYLQYTVQHFGLRDIVTAYFNQHNQPGLEAEYAECINTSIQEGVQFEYAIYRRITRINQNP